ncbi:MAG: DUF1552 domain-containing protein [Pirellulaceae bacterium]|nr:DUF1552 domain-containing protein [Pirellulaceae bacterium]
MHIPNINLRRSIDRRSFLRNAGAVAIGLPFLEAMELTIGQRTLGAATTQSPRRLVSMCAGLGFHTPFLFPEDEEQDCFATPYLSKLVDFRGKLTAFSGLSHPNQQGNNGHASALTWLTSAQRPGLAGFKNSISLDQRIAAEVGHQTRFPFLALSHSGSSLSWSSNGVEIPGMTVPSKLFKSLFIEGTKDEIEAEMKYVRRGQSILDSVQSRTQQLTQNLGKRDQEKLSEYLTAVRDLEKRLQQSEGWIRQPKPKVDVKPPVDILDKADAINRQKLMYDMIVLALQTDSTRTITYELGGLNQVPTIPGVKNDWHNLSHHGKDPEKIDELKLIEEAEFEVFAQFLKKLDAIQESDGTLLDNTSVLYGSNLGNASAHDWHNLPIMVAGGRFKHSGYVAHDEKSNTPFANLFVVLAQQMGIEIDRFGSSTSNSIRGLETG